MSTKPTALDAYLARTAAIHSKLERLRQFADDHVGHDPDAIHRVTSMTSGGRRPGWVSCGQSSAATMCDDAHKQKRLPSLEAA